MAIPDDSREVPSPADRPWSGTGRTPRPYLSRRSRIGKRAFAVTSPGRYSPRCARSCSAIVLIRHFSHPHETAAQRQQREELEAAARDPEAQPDALRKRLEQQRALAETRKNAQQPPASAAVAGGIPLEEAGIPKGRPGDDASPFPPGYHPPGAGTGGTTDADRLARPPGLCSSRRCRTAQWIKVRPKTRRARMATRRRNRSRTICTWQSISIPT